MNYPVDNLHPYDLEVYPNFFLFGCKILGRHVQFSQNDPDGLRRFLTWFHQSGYTLCGYNSNRYDDIVLTAFLNDPRAEVAYQTSINIIEHGMQPWHFDFVSMVQSVDLMPVLPGRSSLKKLGVVMGFSRLQELPIDPHTRLTTDEKRVICDYNKIDLDLTELLRDTIQPELDLRAVMSQQYNVDLRSRGEANIAEHVLLAESRLNKRQLRDAAQHNIAVDPVIRISPPTWWSSLDAGQYPSLATVLAEGERLFAARPVLRGTDIPGGVLAATVYLGDRYYRMGIGGLHSVDGPGVWQPGPQETLVDFDVASYYPSLILTQQLRPQQWGESFLPTYQAIVERRLAAKRAGDKVTTAVLKIVANGTFGKFGDQWSSLFDPTALLSVTLSGQLALLVLVAMLTDKGHQVVSANTDGVTVLCRANAPVAAQAVVQQWERLTALVMEDTPYRALYQRDVNAYVAVKDEGKVKAKGALSPYRSITNRSSSIPLPSADVCALAVCEYLGKGVPLDRTVLTCPELQKFIMATQVTGNWRVSFGGQRLGKMVRWYRSSANGVPPILRTPLDESVKGSEGRLPDSENGMPVPDLPPGLPDDLDHDWYIERAQKMLDSIIVPKSHGFNRKAEILYQLGLTPAICDLSATRLSRARTSRGETDFNSMGKQEALGLSTGPGTGVLAMFNVSTGYATAIYKVPDHYPSSTRKLIERDSGIRLVYGANVPLDPTWHPDELQTAPAGFFDESYTPAELKKVGR